MAAASMPKGLKVAIKFTPQATDDVLSFTEDSGGIGYGYDTADLLANDLATGAADTAIQVSSQGGGAAGVDQTFVLHGVDMTTLGADDGAIISGLLAANRLIVDA